MKLKEWWHGDDTPTKKLFRKKVTVEDIHRDFKTTAEAFVAETTKAATTLEPPVKPELLERYARLGLTGNKHIREFEIAKETHDKMQEDFDKQQKLVKIIEDYRVQYPLQPFIPHQNLLDLCTKYGLVFGRERYFIEDIPLNCLEAMEKFKLKQLNDGIEEAEADFARGGAVSGVPYEIKPASQGVHWETTGGPGDFVFPARGVTEAITAMSEALRSLGTGRSSDTLYPGFYIVGTKDMFKLPGNRKWDEKKRTSVVDDPLVLKEVKHGWLLIAAWGPEAELPEVNIFKQ